MKNKSIGKQNGINLYIMKYVPDRNEPLQLIVVNQ